MEPNTLMEQIFSRFTIQSPILRDIKITSELVDEIPHLVVMEAFDANVNNTSIIGRIYKTPMSVEALNIAKLLSNLVKFERSFIKSATLNIKNFEFLGVFENSMVDIGVYNFKVTQDLDLFYNYFSHSISELARIFLEKKESRNYFNMFIEPISTNVHRNEDENEKYTRTFNYIGRTFEIVPEMFKTTFNTNVNSFGLVVKHTIEDTNGITHENIVVKAQLVFNTHMSIKAVSEMNLVEPGIITDNETLNKFLNNIVSDSKYDSLDSSLTIVTNFKTEPYNNTLEEIYAEVKSNLFLNGVTDVEVLDIKMKPHGSDEWVDTNASCNLTNTKINNLEVNTKIVVGNVIPESVDDPLNDLVDYRVTLISPKSKTPTLELLFSTYWSSKAEPLTLNSRKKK